MERDEGGTKERGAEDKGSQEIETSKEKKEIRYRFFVKHSLEVAEEVKKMKQVTKKRLAFRSFYGDMRDEPKQKHLEFLKRSAKGVQKVKLSLYLKKKDMKLREALKRHHRFLRQVNLFTYGWVNEKQLKYLDESVRKLCNLENFLLYFDLSGFGDQELQRLGRCFKRMCNLKRTRMNFKNAKATMKGFQALAAGFKRLKILNEIDLKLPILQAKVFQGLTQSLKRMKSLARVNLRYDFFVPLSEETEELKQSLKEFGFIPNLGLELDRVSRGGVELLSENFNILQLKRLFLYLTSQDTHEILFENLGSADYLESLHLFVPLYNNMNEKAFIILCQSLSKLHSLKNLNFDFSRWRGFSEEILETLSQTFENPASLKSVSIDLPPLQKFTNKGFHALKDGLCKAKCLEKIELKLVQLTSLKDEDLQQFMESLEELAYLKDLVLSFDRLSGLTKESLNAISESLKRMPSIQRVQLSFEKCEGVSEKDVNGLIQKLKELPIKGICRHDQ